MARCAGLKRDLRLNKFTTYNNYYFLNFNSYISTNGDSYDRFLLRIFEIIESLSIINQNLLLYKNILPLPNHDILSYTNNEYTSMEDMIKHFKF